MLQSLLPRAHDKVRTLPLLGAIAEGFDDWLIASGYTLTSRRCAIHMLTHVDAALRRRHSGDIASLTHEAIHASWRDLMKVFPNGAGTALSVERYLITAAVLTAGGSAPASASSRAVVLSEEYADHLRDVRGFAASTVSHHRYAAHCFLDHLRTKETPLDSLQAKDIEGYIGQVGKRISRASLQHEVAVVRGLLRYLATDGRAPVGVDRQIDTPRLYQMEKLPRALPWDLVIELLKSIDTGSAMGLRDYTMLLMIATYGLRASEVVAITLDDISWRQGRLRVHQCKTSAPLELPLTNEVLDALVRHLKCTPPPAPYRRIFLRMRAPMGLLKPTAIVEVFQSAVRHSGLKIPLQGAHCLRHSLAVHLLKNGTPLKTIGDILGHRTAQSTSVYLRLATGDLREVSLAVPGIRAKGGQ